MKGSAVSALAVSSAAAAQERDLASASRLTDDLSAEYLEYAGVVPLAADEERLLVATWWEAVDVQTVDDLRLVLGAEPTFVRIDETRGRDLIHRLYGEDPRTAEGVIADLGDMGAAAVPEELAIDDLRSLANQAPVVRLVNLLLLEALQARASDIHLEGYSTGLQVRYRVDGVLQDAPSPPAGLAPAVVSRLKIMAELDIAERRVPQDGRIRLRLQDRPVDVRVSTLPALHGESVVLRLLDKERGRIALSDLGMAPEMLRAFVAVTSRPHGIVLATGPTGSGKTTTLYAALDRIRTGREKILTVEDPVEYELPGVPQVAVNERVGLTFASALRALLRQDPDVLLVGEIRDEETADIATHAALTGHLVLSTLHTNDAPSALTRLLDLGIPAYLVASTVEAVLAQRLVRKICDTCRIEADPSGDELAALGVERDQVAGAWRGTGCDACRGTGFRGRTGVYELLLVDEAIRRSLATDPGAGEIRARAVADGMHTLAHDAVRLVREGMTSVGEAVRVVVGGQ